MGYIITKCPKCGEQNAVEKSELEKEQVGYRDPAKASEYRVICKHCLEPYKITVKWGKGDGTR